MKVADLCVTRCVSLMSGMGLWFAFATTVPAADLTVLIPRHYEDPKLYRSYMERFEVSPNFVFYETEDEALELMQRGAAPDVAQLCAADLNEWSAAGYLDDWSAADFEMPEWSPGLDVTRGGLAPYENKFVPFEYGLTRLMYNAGQVPASDVASLDVFINPAYRGKVTLPAYLDDLAAAAFLSQGVHDWTMVDDATFDAAIDWLRAANMNVHSYWQSEEELVDNLADGRILVAWAWNSIYYEMQDYARNFLLAPGSSGATLWACGHVKLTTSTAPSEQVSVYVSSTTERSAGRVLMSWGSGFGNRAVEEDLQRIYDPDESGLTPPDGPLLVQTPMPLELRDRFRRAARDIIARS